MFFPISGVFIHPLILAGIGFIVGILGGFFGVGGGFIAGPLMIWAGVPINFVVGTDLAHMTGKSIVAARRHRALGNVDLRLALFMVIGTIPGIELGAQLLEHLKVLGNIEHVVGYSYVAILTAIGLFTGRESLRALRMKRTDQLEAKGVSDVILVGMLTGFLAGFLGVGGGFLRLPLLVYVLGIPTHVAVGTDLFEIIISAGYGTVSHALKGNVDIMIALTMHTGAAIGAQIGAVGTRYFSGPTIRLMFSILPLIAAIMVLLRIGV
jgi:uncharacterized membrane protein YfcA